MHTDISWYVELK